MRSMTRAAHLKNLDDGTRGAELHTERVAVAERGRGHLLLARAERLDRAEGVARLRRTLELFVGGRLVHPPPEIDLQLVGPSLEEEFRVGDRRRRIPPRRDLADAGGDAQLDVMLEAGPARSPSIASLQDRIPNSRWVRLIVRRAKDAGRNGPIDVAVARVDAAGDKHPRKPLAGGHLQVRIVLVVAEEDVVRGAFCLMRWFSSASASTTESVTMTSS